MKGWGWFTQRPDRGAWVAAIIGVLVLVVNTRAADVLNVRLPMQWTWAVTILLLLLVIAVIGASVSGRPDGVVIDNRNRVSLSKFQATLWTILVLSAVIVAAAAKAYATKGEAALALGIPAELLIAMGISSASLAATPLILSMKKSNSSVELLPERSASNLLAGPHQSSGDSVVFSRSNASQASWADMFRGEEVSNVASPDLGKIQQFVVSVGLVALYGGMLWARFVDGRILIAFPPLGNEFVWLLGISHASYLAYKAAPHGSSTVASTNSLDEAVG
ncbi:hypothetical protein SH591_06190 [Sphingomonas sp. LY54]|uniref:hypothetical protein n=1 Tax=Sphingomonas sp. LY54 TaxID=3095343 RepID=UPI002D76A447|nr:hypothetical protein [Sphingomonas sp. LY54]WRP29769.1 hypothetical protein SH591_06190 [Sphingomonas sp. LY54]